MDSPRIPDFERLIAAVSRALAARGVPFMLIGGQAVLLHGEPRLTQDIDVTLGVAPDRLPEVTDAAAAAGLTALPEELEDFVNETFVLPCEEPETGVRVDFIFSSTSYEARAIDRAVGRGVRPNPGARGDAGAGRGAVSERRATRIGNWGSLSTHHCNILGGSDSVTRPERRSEGASIETHAEGTRDHLARAGDGWAEFWRPANFRSDRVRRRVHAVPRRKCGLVDPDDPCRYDALTAGEVGS